MTTDPTGDDGRDAAKLAAYLKFRTNPEIPAHRASSRSSGTRSRRMSGLRGASGVSGRNSVTSENGGGLGLSAPAHAFPRPHSFAAEKTCPEAQFLQG